MPPPPPPGPPPPPLPNLKLSGGDSGRNELLASIRGGTTLKKTQTNDRSGPVIDSKKNLNTSSSNGNVSALHNGNGTAKFPAGPVGLGGIGGLMAGGIPKLRPTGRGRALPGISSENPQVGIRAPVAPQPEASVPPNRRPSPPQPPPASNKPTMNGNYTRTEPSPNPPVTNKPNPALGQRKPNLAPRPPIPPSPTSPAGKPNPPSQSSKPSIPPKSPSMSSSQSNFSLPSPPPALPNGRPPSVGRSQSVRVGMKPAPAPPLPAVPPNLGHSLIGQVSSSSETSLNKPSPGLVAENAAPYPRPHPPREGHATLPRVPPPAPGGKYPSSAISSRPNERPPPPPPLRQIPPHPGVAPPPPPPNVAPPQPPQFPAAAQPRHRSTPAPPPPMSLPLMDGSGSGPPIVPPRDSSLRKQSIILDEIERRFGTMFRPLSQLTAPEPFTGVTKTYPSQIATMNQSQRRAQAPQPPNLTHLQIGNKMWATNASDC